jgi:hypothetical protein
VVTGELHVQVRQAVRDLHAGAAMVVELFVSQRLKFGTQPMPADLHPCGYARVLPDAQLGVAECDGSLETTQAAAPSV